MTKSVKSVCFRATARKSSAFSSARIRRDIRLLSSTAILGIAAIPRCTHSNCTLRDRQESTFCVSLITYMIDLHAAGRRFLEPSFLCRSSVRQALDVEDEMTDLQYPIGKFHFAGPLTEDQKQTCLTDISQTPANLRAAVTGLSEQQLDTPYRPGGWTIRQVVHHVPDSHLNAYIRMKFAITEQAPAIKAYDEARWAELPEAKTGPADMSVALLEALHRRWVAFLRALPEAEFGKAYVHPELGRVTLDEALALYAWHGC